ncbi:MFS transporter [Nocardia callitridis]|uniref:MFS transporter n=1 Tax=Nocardia callitridis TaxID=648753 RepID=A0ABP9KG81_9NOCA
MGTRPTGSITPVLRGARIANSFAFALQGFFFAVVLTELPQQKERFGLSDGLIVGSVVLVSLLAGVGSVAAEWLATRWSSRLTVRLGLGLIAVTGCAIAFAPNTATVLTALGAYGVAVGMVDASTTMQAVFIQRGYGMFILNSFYAAWSAGSIAGALFVSGFEKLAVGVLASVLTAAAVVLVLGLALGPYLLRTRDAEAEPELAEGSPNEHTAAVDGVPVALRAYLAIGVAMALVFAIDLAVGNWSALYLTDDLLADSATAALGLAAYQGTSLIARLTGDRMVRRFGPRAVVRVAAMTGVVGLVLVVSAPGPLVAIIGFLVAGIGMPVIAPLCFSAASRLASGRALDALIARLNLFNYAGTLLGGGLVGAVAALFGHRPGFLIPLLFAIVLIGFARVFAVRPDAEQRAAPPTGRAVLEG